MAGARWALRGAALCGILASMLLVGAGPVSAGTGPTTGAVGRQLCAPALPGYASCDAVRLEPGHGSVTGPSVLGCPVRLGIGNGPCSGYAPADLASAYGVSPAAATTQTVGIVDAYDDPSVLADLDHFDAYYSLPDETPSSFEVVNQSGASSPLPASDVGWAGEITLDVETVRGLCQACKIVLVEASSASDVDLAAAVNEAVALGATIVSNSYGGPEFAGDSSASAYSHAGVAILASSGDDGWYDWDWKDYAFSGFMSPSAPEVPAAYSTVVGVGGTSLRLSGMTWSQTVWNDNGLEDSGMGAGGASGGGCSGIYSAPPWEAAVAGYASLGCGSGLRSGVDVAADADPETGYDIYETTTSWCTPGQMDGSGNDACPSQDPLWGTYGGTSLASPLVASLWALAGGPEGVTDPALTLYGHFQTAPSEFYDVTSGGNGYCGTDTATTCQANAGASPNLLGYGLLDCRWDGSGNLLSAIGQCNAGTGFDGPSGVGAPTGSSPFAPLSPTAVITPPSSVSQGVAATFSGASSSAPFPGDSIAQYTWNWGDGTSTSTSSPTTTHTYVASGAHTVTLTAADAYASDNGGRTGLAESTVNVAAVNHALTVSRLGTGKGSVGSNPSGIDCGSSCSHSYAYGTQVTLTATPSSGSTFAGWSGACSGKSACTVTLSNDQSVKATFTAGCVVPKVTGKTLAAAKSAIRKAHCAVGKVKTVSSAKKQRGKVVSQRPGAGKKLPAGAKVSLTVGKP